VFRLFYRFSLEKLLYFSENLELMVLLLQYLAETGLKRVHTKDSMSPNATCYYRAVENLVNESKDKDKLIKLIKQSSQFSSLNIEIVNQDGEESLKLTKLENENIKSSG